MKVIELHKNIDIKMGKGVAFIYDMTTKQFVKINFLISKITIFLERPEITSND